jgi:NADH dehydrogenase
MAVRKQRLVILGGGFAGLIVARKFVQSGFIKDKVDVTVIDRNDAHLYTPWLYEVSSGFLSHQTTKEERCDLFVSASVPFEQAPGYEGVRFRKGSIKTVDPKTKTVHLDDGLTVQYDILLIALGAEPNYFGIPGLPEHCFPLKSVDDAMKIERAATLMLKGITGREKKHIVIVGGGPSGVELTGELRMAVKTLEASGELAPGTAEITIVDRSKILSVFPPSVNDRVVKRLNKIGVNVKEGYSVLEAKKGLLMLKKGEGDEHLELPADITVWAGGIMPSKIAQALPFPHDPKGKIIIDETFAVPGFPGVFAAGDCALLMNPRTKTPEPQSAQVAVHQGMWIAKNMHLMLEGKKMRPFSFRKGWDVLIAVGGKYGVGNVLGVTLSGYIGYAMRRVTDFRYFYWVLPFAAALKKWSKAVKIYTNNDG